MKFLKYSFITLLSIVLIGSAGYLLAAGGMQAKPGYADLTLPGLFSSDTKIVLNLGPRGLMPVRWAINHAYNGKLNISEQMLLNMLQDLEGVRIRVYEVDENRMIYDEAIEESYATLKQDGWQTLLTAREDNKRIIVMQSGDNELITGFSILVSTPENAIFVNLLGQLKPESIALVADSLN